MNRRSSLRLIRPYSQPSQYGLLPQASICSGKPPSPRSFFSLQPVKNSGWSKQKNHVHLSPRKTRYFFHPRCTTINTGLQTSPCMCKRRMCLLQIWFFKKDNLHNQPMGPNAPVKHHRFLQLALAFWGVKLRSFPLSPQQVTRSLPI